MEYCVRIRTENEDVTVPTDGRDDSHQMGDILRQHLKLRLRNQHCSEADLIHRVLRQKGVTCPCLINGFLKTTEHQLQVLAETSRCHVGPAVCCVCMSDADPATDRILSCGHLFHASCVQEWFTHNASCPTCRVKQTV